MQVYTLVATLTWNGEVRVASGVKAHRSCLVITSLTAAFHSRIQSWRIRQGGQHIGAILFPPSPPCNVIHSLNSLGDHRKAIRAREIWSCSPWALYWSLQECAVWVMVPVGRLVSDGHPVIASKWILTVALEVCVLPIRKDQLSNSPKCMPSRILRGEGSGNMRGRRWGI